MLRIGCVLLALASAAAAEYEFSQAQALLRGHCAGCHRGKQAAAGFDLNRYPSEASMVADARAWRKAVARVRDHEMPPKQAPAPSLEAREQFVGWLDSRLKAAACADGISAAAAPVRRLNRSEYSATIRDLLNIHINAGRDLPADGAGGEGFDNAAETLFLSPIHAEKYLEAARQALAYGARDPKSRAVFLIAEPNAQTPPEDAARKVLEHFVPRAFRRPARAGEVVKYLALFRAAQAQGYEEAILYALRAVLVSPHFLFRIESGGGAAGDPVDDYAMASRLSYFLWGSMPDTALMELAAKGRLNQPDTLRQQVERMLKDAKSRDFAERFVEQWLGTRELGRDIKPDAKLFPEYYDQDLQGAIRYEPILFFHEIFSENLSLLNLIDSKFTVLTSRLARHYGLPSKGLSQQPKHYDLPENSQRGGVVSMAAVLAVSSYAHRTSPVLRGKWALDALLGTPPPPPPPNVPELPENKEGVTPRTLRERLTQHRQNAVCASCHSRIDPLGFGLENYDVLGRWRSHESPTQPIDASGEMPDGTKFEGPAGLKQVLLKRKEQFLRNLTAKMFGYALGRGLNAEDACAVDEVVAKLEGNAFSAHSLVQGVVLSVPFRLQSAPIEDAKRKK